MDVKSRMIGAALGAVLSFGIVSAGVAFAQEATDDSTTTTEQPATTDDSTTDDSTGAVPEKEGCEDGPGGGRGESTVDSSNV